MAAKGCINGLLDLLDIMADNFFAQQSTNPSIHIIRFVISLRLHRRAFVGEDFFQVGIARLAEFERLLIMPAGEFRQRRLLVDVNHGEIVVRGRVFRIELERLAQRRLRLRAQPLVAERDAEVILDFGILRVELRRAAQGVERVVVFALLKFQVAEHGKVVGVVWVLRDGGLKVPARRHPVCPAAFQSSPGCRHQRVVRVALEDLQVIILGLVILPGGKMPLRLGHQRRRAGGQFAHGFFLRRPGWPASVRFA